SQELSQLICVHYSQTREKDAHLNAIAEVSPCCHCHHGQESSASPNVQDNGFFPSLFYSANCSTNTLKILGPVNKIQFSGQTQYRIRKPLRSANIIRKELNK
ncbi:hypothetical protein E2320_001079, partial [Naja naja]